MKEVYAPRPGIPGLYRGRMEVFQMIDLENARAFVPFEIRAAEGTQNERLDVPGVLNVCTNTFHIDSAFEREYERRFEGFPPLHALIEAR